MIPLRLLLAAACAVALSTSAALAGVERPVGPDAREALASAAPADTDSVAGRDTTERRREARPDTVERDTIEVDSAADSAATDSAAIELRARRQALSGGEFPERDSIFQRLVGLTGFRVVEYRGDRVQLDVEREAVELRGEAQANYTTSVLEADSITYLAEPRLMRAGGNIRLSGEGRTVRSDSSLYYDISRLKGTIMAARTTFAERGAEWYVRGTATPKGDNTVYVEAGNFTTCELEAPHYWFKAGKIKVVSENYIVAWPVVFYVHGIPVAWLPFFAQDIRPGRRSGFLPPRFGFNDIVQTGNTARSISDFGYYLALSPYTDAQFTVDWLSGSFTRLNGAFRYRHLKKFLRGNVLTSYSFGDAGRNLEVQAHHDQQLGPSTDLRVDARFIRNTRLFEDRTFDPTQQTQTINTDVGFNHKLDFAALNLSARRQQFLGDQSGRTTLELPQLRMTFSPLTFFRAPALRAGPFNNLVWSGNLTFNRQLRLQEAADDQTTTRANYGNSLRLGRFNVSGTANLNDIRTVPFIDSLGVEGDPFSQTTINWSSGADYQVDLMGSTVLRPTLQVDGAQFKSRDTGGDFVSTPARLNIGATLSTDLYGFFPGFGPFSRIRHKLSPSFQYTYSPEQQVADSLLQIPGFPGGSAAERNLLTVTLRQTFEAKVKPGAIPEEARDEEVPGEEAELREGEVPGPEEAMEEEPEEEEPEGEVTEAEGPEEVREEAPEQEREEVPEEVREEAPEQEREEVQEEVREAARPERPAAGPTGRGRRPQQERKFVLLAINSSSLAFDFARENEPALVTDAWRHNLTSDLLRGFSFNLTLDLFEGVGEERRFSPFLSELTGGLSINSQAGLAGLFGLGEPGRRPARPRRPSGRGFDSRYRLSTFEEAFDDPLDARAGPWNLSVNYSLSRRRPEEPGEGRQSIGGNLRLAPTPNWRIRWQTQYNLTDGEFGLNSVFLERDLHRWEASFGFSKSPNGNFHFQVMVNLRDAPEVRVDYDQQTLTGR